MPAFDLGRPFLLDLGVMASVTVERTAVAATVDAYGDPVEPSPSLIVRDVATYWASPRELKREGLDHTTAARVFLSDSDLLVAGTANASDVVRYDSERWQVFWVEDYLAEAGLVRAFTKRVE